MSILRYKVFAEVAQSRNMSRTAERLHMSPPNISYSIAQMEKEWGVRLLVRGHSKVSLTQEGKRLLPHVNRVLAAYDTLQEEVKVYQHHHSSVVRVGALSGLALHWLPDIIRQYHLLYPTCKVDITLHSYEEICNCLDEGLIDLAITLNPHKKQYRFISITEDSFAAILPRGHSLQGRCSLTLDHLEGEQFIVPNWDDPRMQIYQDPRITSNTAFLLGDPQAIVSLALEGLGVGILPQFALYRGQLRSAALLADWKPVEMGVLLYEGIRSTQAMKGFIICIQGLALQAAERR